MRKTKIICTLGPSTDDRVVLKQLVENGMDVARLNFSHGSHEEHLNRIKALREVCREVGRQVAILLDTKGPEIRTKTFKEDAVKLEEGNTFILTGRDVEGDKSICSVTYENLAEDISVGDTILLDDGLIELKVENIKDKDVECQVINSGIIKGHKGINIPNSHIRLPYLSEKDTSDILFGIENDVDFIAASFVRTPEDVLQIRRLLNKNGGENIMIMSKIENKEGIDNIDDIIEESDAIMVARGDLGVEIPAEDIPIVQKLIIKKVYQAGKAVVTATQMLDSMMNQKRPTRAEVTDVANAVYDGTSAIMLSGETAAGKYPAEALKTMSTIAERTEQDIDYMGRFYKDVKSSIPDTTEAICHATCTTAYDLKATAIVAITKSGRAARMISRFRPACMIIGATTDEKALRQLNLSWGVRPIMLEEKSDMSELFFHAVQSAKREKLVESGDLSVISCGIPLKHSGTTNMLKVQMVE